MTMDATPTTRQENTTMATRTDIPMGGLHRSQRDLESLNTYISLQTIDRPADPEFIRTVILGILARLDAAIVTINES